MAFMELRKKAQITIPKEIVLKLGLKEGDQLEVFERGGEIIITPVVIYPKKQVERLVKLVKEAEMEYRNGDMKVYENINEMFKELDLEESD